MFVIKIERKTSNEIGFLRVDYDSKIFFTRKINCATFFETEDSAKKMFRKIFRSPSRKPKQDIQADISGINTKRRQEKVVVSIVVLIEYKLQENAYTVFKV